MNRRRNEVLVVVALAAATMALASCEAEEEGPVGVLEMSGDVGRVSDPTHDPALIRDDDTYYVFSTGALRDRTDPGGIYLRRSTGGLEGPWESLGELPVPDWTLDYGHSHLWAPQVVHDGSMFHLYYAASSFGRNSSAIGRMTSSTPAELDSWEDQGPVLSSGPGDPFNAIDGHVFESDGERFITFGSHWDGIFLQALPDLHEPSGTLHHLATRPGVQHNPIEAPTIFEHDGWYYLLTSWDRCCAGINSTYRITVGRSESATGPYVDRDGVPLLEGGGTVLLDSDGDQIGPGGQDVLFDRGRHYLAHHYYDGADSGTIRLQIRSLDWDDGWPTVARLDDA